MNKRQIILFIVLFAVMAIIGLPLMYLLESFGKRVISPGPFKPLLALVMHLGAFLLASTIALKAFEWASRRWPK